MASHVPVLLGPVMAALQPVPDDLIVDGTFGAGGYTGAILKEGAQVVAFDRDPTAIAAGRERFAGQDRLTLVEAPFDRLEDELADLGHDGIDGAVFDFGVSSMQLDQAARGFSFMADGPLDMRMGEGRSAAEFLNEAEPEDIANVLYQYGEEKKSRAIARAVAEDRGKTPFETTAQLAGLCERIVGRGQKVHPATRTFQALRIFVNDELGQIVRALISSERLLFDHARLVCVSFHSLEDRIVKRFFAEVSGKGQGGSRHLPQLESDEPTFRAIAKAVTADEAELAQNPRARSATLRAGTRTAAPARDWTPDRLSRLGVPPITFSDLQREWSLQS